MNDAGPPFLLFVHFSLIFLGPLNSSCNGGALAHTLSTAIMIMSGGVCECLTFVGCFKRRYSTLESVVLRWASVGLTVLTLCATTYKSRNYHQGGLYLEGVHTLQWVCWCMCVWEEVLLLFWWRPVCPWVVPSALVSPPPLQLEGLQLDHSPNSASKFVMSGVIIKIVVGCHDWFCYPQCNLSITTQI